MLISFVEEAEGRNPTMSVSNVLHEKDKNSMESDFAQIVACKFLRYIPIHQNSMYFQVFLLLRRKSIGKEQRKATKSKQRAYGQIHIQTELYEPVELAIDW